MAWRGQTLGKWLFGIRVLRADTGTPQLGVDRAASRALLLLVNSILMVGPIGNSWYGPAPAGTLLVCEEEYQWLTTFPPEQRSAYLQTDITMNGTSYRRALVNLLALIAIVALGWWLASSDTTSPSPTPRSPNTAPWKCGTNPDAYTRPEHCYDPYTPEPIIPPRVIPVPLDPMKPNQDRTTNEALASLQSKQPTTFYSDRLAPI